MVVEFIFDIETTGLEKETNRITCISLKQIGTNDIITFIDEDEKKILEAFFRKLQHCDCLYSFNGDGFDVPFLIYRSILLDIQTPENFQFPKHVDLRKIAGCFFFNYEKYLKGSLNDWAKILCGECKATNGLECIKAWEEKNYQLIKEHCEFDVYVAELLYNRVKKLGILEQK